MTENVFNLPSSYKMGKVVGRIVHAIADTPEDEDAYPEARAASGSVTFTPAIRQHKVTDDDYPAIIMHEVFTSSLNSQGRITDSEGRIGLWLFEGVWTVSFDLDKGSISPFDIQVTRDHTDLAPLDVVTAVPYSPPAGMVVKTMLIPHGGIDGQALIKSGDDVVWGDVQPEVDLSGLVQNTDPRLSDARTPTAHDHAVADVTGLQAALDGKQDAGSYAASTHTHSVTDLTATGTKDATTYLRGDNTWATPTGGGATAKEVRSAMAGDYSYMGTAPLNTLESAASWKISRIALTGTVGSVTTATGAAWDDRESAVYS